MTTIPPSPRNLSRAGSRVIFDFDDTPPDVRTVQEGNKDFESADGVSNKKAWCAGRIVTCISIVLLGATIALDENAKEPPAGKRDLHSPVGWTGLVCALVLFGSIAVMVKIPSVMDADIDPMVFQIYQSGGIVFVSAVLFIYEIIMECGTSSITFSWWGVVGAGIIYVAQAFAYNGVRGLGSAVGPATWAGLGMCVSFIW
jgi:hypothetical protein